MEGCLQVRIDSADVFVLIYIIRSAWDVDKDAYMRRYANTKRPLSSYDMDITRYKCMQEDIQSEDPTRTARFIRIDCSRLKSSLVAHCIDWQNRLTMLLHSNATTELQSLRELMSSTTEELMREPKDLEQLGNGLNLLARLKKEVRCLSQIRIKRILNDSNLYLIFQVSSIDSRFDPLDDMFRTLTKFGVVIPDEEKDALDNLRPSWKSFLVTIQDAETMLTQVKHSMKRGLELSIDAFNESLIENRRLFLCMAFIREIIFG